MGCQRIVFDVSYLRSLHRENVKLANQPVRRLTETGLITCDGTAFWLPLQACSVLTLFQVNTMVSM